MKDYIIDDNLGFFHDCRAIYLRFIRKLIGNKYTDGTLERFKAFDEEPPCAMCGGMENNEVLIAIDGCRIVECENCGLWFTSPRIKERDWEHWLQTVDNERNQILTENRIRYGMAMPRNVKLARSGWFKRLRKKYLAELREIQSYAKKTGSHNRLHDVGCGVGFFLLVCRENGFDVSGNDLNEYAVKVMTERFGLKIFNSVLKDTPLEPESLDVLTMNAYIEHTYHPLEDLLAAHNLLKKDGLLYVSTFHVDSVTFDKTGDKWDMFAWNHVYHFSSNSLENMINKAGFSIIKNNMKYEFPISYILARKE